MRHILLVDDEANVLSALKRALRRHGMAGDSAEPVHIETFTDPFEALTRCCSMEFDVVISDQHMPRMMGVDFLNALKEVSPNTVRLMLSAATEFETAISAINHAEVFRFLHKPWQDEELRDNLNMALRQRDKLLDNLGQDQAARSRPEPSAQELETERLEADEPGITHVRWGPDGSIIL